MMKTILIWLLRPIKVQRLFLTLQMPFLKSITSGWEMHLRQVAAQAMTTRKWELLLGELGNLLNGISVSLAMISKVKIFQWLVLETWVVMSLVTACCYRNILSSLVLSIICTYFWIQTLTQKFLMMNEKDYLICHAPLGKTITKS